MRAALRFDREKKRARLREVEIDPLSRAVAETVAETSLKTLRTRGEPTSWPTLHAAIYAALAESSLLAQVADLTSEATPLSWLSDAIRSTLEGAPLRQLLPLSSGQPQEGPTTPLWWLDEPLEQEAARPLSDRVELAVVEILQDLLAVSEMDLQSRVCARFPGAETPSGRLIHLCLVSYGDEHAPGHWRLRAEDDLKARAVETGTVTDDLTLLGNRLGFSVEHGTPNKGEWAVRWEDETGHPAYVFAVRTSGVLGDLLFRLPSHPPLPPKDGTSITALHPSSEPHRDSGLKTEPAMQEDVKPVTVPCLTLPGGRAALVSHKLRHNPRLSAQVDVYGWQFLKFRHLRHLVQEVKTKQLDRYAFQAALGLDPVVEQEEAQMSLW
jgi:hypothetical protein